MLHEFVPVQEQCTIGTRKTGSGYIHRNNFQIQKNCKIHLKAFKKINTQNTQLMFILDSTIIKLMFVALNIFA